MKFIVVVTFQFKPGKTGVIRPFFSHVDFSRCPSDHVSAGVTLEAVEKELTSWRIETTHFVNHQVGSTYEWKAMLEMRQEFPDYARDAKLISIN